MQMNARIIRRANVRLGRDAHFAHLVHICMQQLIVHIRVYGIEFAQHRFIISRIYRSISLWSSRRLSPILFLPFVADGKKTLHHTRARLAPFFFLRTFLPSFCRPVLPLPLHVRLSSVRFLVARLVTGKRRRKAD